MDRQDRFIAELSEWVAIPSVSGNGLETAAMFESAQWMADYLVRSGGSARVERFDGSAPCVVGHLVASDGENAPTVLVYGHHDVQPVGEASLWRSDPFRLDHRGDWLHGRGSADDKGNVLMIMDAARALKAAKRLEVNVMFFGDGEEEVGGDVAARWLRSRAPSFDGCVIFDAPMPARGMPALCLGTRGLLDYTLTISTGSQDVHSGVFGGAATNAAQVVAEVLVELGRLVRTANEELPPPDVAELRDWQRLPPGELTMRDSGVLPIPSTGRVDDFYRRTLTQHSLDVHSIESGAQNGARCVLHSATCRFSIRVAPGACPSALDDRVRTVIAGHPGAASACVTQTARIAPSSWDPASTPVESTRRALTAGGFQPVYARIGGSFALAGELANRAIATTMTGFDVPEGNAHAPNERLFVPYISAGIGLAEGLLGDAGCFIPGRTSWRRHRHY